MFTSEEVEAMIGTAHRTPLVLCPWCDKELDAASGLDHDRVPKVGDLGVCITCGGVNIYALGLILTRCPETVWQAEPEPVPTEIRTARRAIRELNSKRD
jgi:hypothetical protein